MGNVNLTNPSFNGRISVSEEGLEPFLATGWVRDGEDDSKTTAKKTAAKKSAPAKSKDKE